MKDLWHVTCDRYFESIRSSSVIMPDFLLGEQVATAFGDRYQMISQKELLYGHLRVRYII